jgi:excisionase family DNA binding protein
MKIRQEGGVPTLRPMAPKHGVTRRRRQRQAAVLELQRLRPAASQVELAKWLGINSSTLSDDRREIEARRVETSLSPAEEWSNPVARWNSAERRAVEVRRLVARGVAKKKIAQRLGISLASVVAVRNAVRILLSEKIAAQARALHAQGVSKSSIARTLSVSNETVAKALETVAGTFVVSAVSSSRRLKRHPDRQRAIAVLEAVQKGLSYREINRRFGVDRETIVRVLEKEHRGEAATIHSPRKMDPKKIHRLANQGVSQAKIARHLDISTRLVRKVILAGKQPSIAPERARALRVLKAVQEGLSTLELNRRFKVTEKTIARVVAQEQRGEAATINIDPRRIRQLANQGISKSEIARRLGISRNTVIRITLTRQRQPTAAERAAKIQASPSAASGRPLPHSRMLTPAELASRLDVDIDVIHEAIARGEIRGVVTLGKQIRLPRSSVVELLRYTR